MLFRRAEARFLILLMSLGCATPVAAEEAALSSHSAIYDMNLATVRSSSGIVGAGGTMTYSFTDTCDGWAVETHTDLTMLQTQGGPVSTTWEFLSWESKDGTSYRFRARNSRNGELLESYEGEARMPTDGAGTAIFDLNDGEPQTFDLDKSTLFPTAHTRQILSRAMQGQRFFSVPVFDGSSVKGAFQVTAAIGRSPLQVPTPELDNALLKSKVWPIVLAFFPPDGDSEFPDFEVSLDYHENGVVQRLLQDFGNFTLRGTLRELKPLSAPNC